MRPGSDRAGAQVAAAPPPPAQMSDTGISEVEPVMPVRIENVAAPVPPRLTRKSGTGLSATIETVPSRTVAPGPRGIRKGRRHHAASLVMLGVIVSGQRGRSGMVFTALV